MCMRAGGSCSRPALSRKLLMLFLLCLLSLLFYYHAIDTTKITYPTHNTLSRLQSYTEVSKQYPEKSSTITSSSSSSWHSPQYQSARNGSSVRDETVAAIHTTVLAPTTHTEHLQSSSHVVANVPSTASSAKTTLRSTAASLRAVNTARGRRKYHYSQSSKSPQVLLLYGVNAYKHSIEIKIFSRVVSQFRSST